MAADQPLMLMDEPFGAVDPIARDRLQDDFLRLHKEVPKTVVFVTHDIDEAIKMGHRIAILRDGELVQYDTPDNILAEPADDFVADFVGADRGLKRLNVWRLGDLELDPRARGGRRPDARTEDTSLRDALSLMLVEGIERLDVVDGDGRPVGTVSARRDHPPDRPGREGGHAGDARGRIRRADRAGAGDPALRDGQRLHPRERPVLLQLVRGQLRPRVRAAARRAHLADR